LSKVSSVPRGQLACCFVDQGWKSSLRSLFGDSGRPRYFKGKCACVIGRSGSMESMSILLHLIVMTLVFYRLVCRPVTAPNLRRRSLRFVTSELVGFRKMTASSTYIKAQNLAVQPLSLLWRPRSVAICSSRCSGSMARMKSSGDNGSPCRRPRPCSIGSSGALLSITREVDVVSKATIQRCHLGGKPLSYKSESK
jgi:hypothetical protein